MKRIFAVCEEEEQSVNERVFQSERREGKGRMRWRAPEEEWAVQEEKEREEREREGGRRESERERKSAPADIPALQEEKREEERERREGLERKKTPPLEWRDEQAWKVQLVMESEEEEEEEGSLKFKRFPSPF